MKKIIKYGVIGAVSILVLAVITIVVVVNFVDPNQFKPVIKKTVYTATGRTLKLNGNISWKLYPNIGVNVKDFSLSNPEGFNAKNSAQEFLQVKSADISVALIPLLSKHIALKTLNIDGLNLSLIKFNGENNWTFSSPDQESQVVTKEFKKSKGLELELSSFSFIDAAIKYDDFDANKHYALNKTKLILDTGFTGGVEFNQDDQEIKLEKVKLNYNDKLLAYLDFKIKNFANLEYDGMVNVEKFQLNSILVEVGINPKNSLLNSVLFNGDIKGNLNQVKVEDMEFNIDNQLQGKFNIKIKNLSNPTYSGNLNLKPFNVNKLLTELPQKDSQSNRIVKSKPLLNRVVLSTNGFSGDKNNIQFDKLNINLNDMLKIAFNQLKVNSFKLPQVSGSIDVSPFNLNQVLVGLGNTPINLANPNWLNSCEFASIFNATTNSLNLQNLKFKISDTNISGNLNVSSLKPVTVTETLNIDTLDLLNISDVNGFRVINQQINLTGSAKLSGNGISSLSGKQVLNVNNITIKGISLDALILEFDKSISRVGGSGGDVVKIIANSSDIIKTVDKIKREVTNAIKPGPKDSNKITNLGGLNVNAVINNRVVNPSSFRLDGPSALVSGNGSINLVNKHINYNAVAKLTLKGINPIFRGLNVPVTITGTTTKPSSSVDWLSLQNQLLKYVVNQNKGQIEKTIKDNINQNVGNELKKVIGDKNADKTVDNVSKNISNAIGNLFGGSK